VVWANDESFAGAGKPHQPTDPVYQPATFGHKGQSTTAGRPAGARARLRPGDHPPRMPGVIVGLVVDIRLLTGNYPPFVSIEGCAVDDYPDPEDLTGWETLVPAHPRAATPQRLRRHPAPPLHPCPPDHLPDGGVSAPAGIRLPVRRSDVPATSTPSISPPSSTAPESSTAATSSTHPQPT